MNIRTLRLTLDKTGSFWEISNLFLCDEDLSQYLPPGVRRSNEILITMSSCVPETEIYYHGHIYTNKFYKSCKNITINKRSHILPSIPEVINLVDSWLRDNGSDIWFKIEYV